MPNQIKDWPHAPVHQLGNDGVFMVTGATLYKQRLFSGGRSRTKGLVQLLGH